MSCPVVLRIRVPSAAWCPGEVIPIFIRVENHSGSSISDVSCYLESRQTVSMIHPSVKVTEAIATVKLGRSVGAKEDVNQVLYLRVPPCCPSHNLGRNLHHNYFLCAKVSKLVSLVTRVPITIGTVPHRSPPLLAEQTSECHNLPVCDWADAQHVAEMAAHSFQPESSVSEGTFQDSYRSQDPDVTLICKGVYYPYFDIPQMNVPVPSVASSTGTEATPLLALTTTDETTTTTTISSSCGSYTPPASIFVRVNNS